MSFKKESNIQEAAGKVLFKESVKRLFEDYQSNKILTFSSLKAKLIVEGLEKYPKAVQYIRFIDNIEELKETFNIKAGGRQQQVLKEEEAAVEELDKVALFTDLATIEGSLSEALSLLYQYKNQYIQSPGFSEGLNSIRKAIGEALDRVNTAVIMIGTTNEGS